MAINNRIGRKRSIHDSVAEFSGDLYLVEGGRSSDKRDAGEGDPIEGWDMEYPIANKVIPLIGNDKLRFEVFCIFILLHQKKIIILVTDASVRLS